MKNLFTVTSFEFEGFIKKKKNWGMVIFVAILAVILALSPFIIELLNTDAPDLMYIYSDKYTSAEIAATFGENAVLIESEEELESLVTSGEVSEYYEIKDEGITFYTKESSSLFDMTNTSTFRAMFSTAYYAQFMAEKGLLEEFTAVAEYVNNISVKEFEVTENGYSVLDSDGDGKNAEIGIRYFVGYVFLMLTYISMMQYGSYAATTVGNEKASRTMETLIYSTDTNSLILGKVAGVFLGAIIQVVVMCILLVGGAIAALNISVSQELLIASDIETLSTILFNFFNLEYILIFIIMYALGFLICLFIFASLTATVSKVEEISSAISTGSIVSMLSFFLGIALLMNADNKILTALSYFPLFTPLAMFTRYTMGSTTTFDMVYAIVVPSITVVLIGMFAAKLYRVGVLLYGTKPNFKTLIGHVFSKSKK